MEKKETKNRQQNSTQPPPFEEWFGFIQFAIRAECAQYTIKPVENLPEIVKSFQDDLNRDGYYYVSEVLYKEDPRTGQSTQVPKSTRPALLFRLPHTHIIETASRATLSKEFRNREGGLFIHLLALLYSSKGQFWNWWFDGRFRGKRDRIAWFRDDDPTLSSVLSAVHSTWSTWPEKAQKLYINSLWLQSRISTYWWDWERFLMAYMVTDSLWALAKEIGAINEKVPHRGRLDRLCERFSLRKNPDLTGHYAELRNDLFHEGLWDKEQPSSGGSAEASMADLRLRHLNERLLLALGQVPCGFIRTNWASMSYFGLDLT